MHGGRQRHEEEHPEGDADLLELDACGSLLSQHGELSDRVGATPAHLDVQRAAEELGALPGPRDGGLDVGGPGRPVR